MITWTLDKHVGYAYISLTNRPGHVAESVDLSDFAEQLGVAAFESLVFDFDQDGRLVGIEVADAPSILPTDLLAERGYDEPAAGFGVTVLD